MNFRSERGNRAIPFSPSGSGAPGTIPNRYTLTGCHIGTFTQSPTGGASAGSVVHLSATATGCTTPQYQFWAYEPNNGGWHFLPNTAPNNPGLANWVTTALPRGDGYYLLVFVKQAGSGNPNYDDYAYVTYSLH